MEGYIGSFLEFLPLLTLLSKKYSPETLPYHVVVPSLPGYTLSDGPPLDMDFTMADLTRIMNQLMVDLGFGKKGYVAQGGDVGSMVARLLAPTSECKAIHGTCPSNLATAHAHTDPNGIESEHDDAQTGGCPQFHRGTDDARVGYSHEPGEVDPDGHGLRNGTWHTSGNHRLGPVVQPSVTTSMVSNITSPMAFHVQLS